MSARNRRFLDLLLVVLLLAGVGLVGPQATALPVAATPVLAAGGGAAARLRRARREDGRARRQPVLGLLFGWPRAVYRARDPMAEPGRCLEAWLDEQQLGAALDLQTGGWLSRWLRGRHPSLPPCIVGDRETEPVEP